MTLLELFWIFLRIGLFTIGGGYAIVPLLQRELTGLGLLTWQEAMDMVGIAEMTPGPLAVNAATFAGMKMHGPVGAVVTTLGVVLPGACLALLAAAFFFKYVKKPPVKAALSGLRAVVMALIAVSALKVAVEVFSVGGTFIWVDAAIAAVCFVCLLFVKKLSPVVLILLSGAAGALLLS